MPNPTPIAATVPSIDTMTERTVKVLAWHPKGKARSSHLSLEPSGQILAEPMGARKGRRAGFGTQVDD